MRRIIKQRQPGLGADLRQCRVIGGQAEQIHRDHRHRPLGPRHRQRVAQALRAGCAVRRNGPKNPHHSPPPPPPPAPRRPPGGPPGLGGQTGPSPPPPKKPGPPPASTTASALAAKV